MRNLPNSDYWTIQFEYFSMTSFNSLNVPDVKREPELPNMAPIKTERLNGFAEEESWSSKGNDLQCCLIDNGKRWVISCLPNSKWILQIIGHFEIFRCTRPAGNASYNKRIQKTVAQKKLKLHMDETVSSNNVQILWFSFHKEPLSYFSRLVTFTFVIFTNLSFKIWELNGSGKIQKMIREKLTQNTQK